MADPYQKLRSSVSKQKLVSARSKQKLIGAKQPLGQTSFHHPQMKGVKIQQSKSRAWVKIPVAHGSVHKLPLKQAEGRRKRVPPGGLTRYDYIPK